MYNLPYFMCSHCSRPYMIKLIPEKKIIHKFCRCGNSLIESIQELKEQLYDKELPTQLNKLYSINEQNNRYCNECNEYYNESNINHKKHNNIDLTEGVNTLSIEIDINKIDSFIEILNQKK